MTLNHPIADESISVGHSLNKLIILEYYDFINSTDCPRSITYRNEKAKTAYNNKQQGIDDNEEVISDNVHDTPVNMPFTYNMNQENIENFEILTCTSFIGRESNNYSALDEGLNYDWAKRIHVTKEKDLTGCHWLDNEVSLLANSMTYKNLPLQKSGSHVNEPYDISLVDQNDCQADIVYTVVEKLKEWVEFPTVLGTNKEYEFKPLRMTVIGAGGTGKSFVINVLRTAVESVFPDTVVSHVTAPTGAASFRAGGTTCHSFLR